MKEMIMLVTWLTFFMAIFFLFSLVGLLWDTYPSIISNQVWFMYYTGLLGSWLPIFPILYVNDKIYKNKFG